MTEANAVIMVKNAAGKSFKDSCKLKEMKHFFKLHLHGITTVLGMWNVMLVYYFMYKNNTFKKG